MITVEEALARCLTAAQALGTEDVHISSAAGRVLAEPVFSKDDVPRWDNSAMDGYAIRAVESGTSSPADASSGTAEAEMEGDCCATPTVDVANLPFADFLVSETIPAGSVGTQSVAPGTCARIMTGAPMPDGSDAVVIREYAEVHNTPDGKQRVRLFGTAKSGQHVRPQGEEFTRGATVLHPGITLNAPALGLCASTGNTHVTVRKCPIVAILSTGDEIVPSGESLLPGQIWSSNTEALCQLVRDAGGIPIDCGNAPDNLEGTRAAFVQALARQPDFLVSTGGVSVGDFDVVKQALTDVGVEMGFWKVRMKPGKPLAFGLINGKPAFGLPGNPVSCMVNFLQFVRPVIRQSLGDPSPFLPVINATLDGHIKKKVGRNELVRVVLSVDENGFTASPGVLQGSSITSSMVHAHGFALLDWDANGAEPGDVIPVQVFNTSFLFGKTADLRWGGRS